MARAKHKILALDLARRTGWACGHPGRRPRSGVYQFGALDCSHEAAFCHAENWARCMIDLHHPTMVVWEAPLPSSFMRGRTKAATTALLFGLPAIVGLVCYRAGIFEVYQAAPSDIRCHFIGRNMRTKEAEVATKAQCRRLGWTFADDNEADALALWDYQCSIVTGDCATTRMLPGVLPDRPWPRKGARHG